MIANAQLLSADRTTVVLEASGLRGVVASSLKRTDYYPEPPRASLPLWAASPLVHEFRLRRVLRLERADGTAEAWRVLRRTTDHTATAASPGCEVELVPLWMDLGSAVLTVDLGAAGVVTPRIALLDRSPEDALAIAFDPAGGAPSVPSGAPMFIVGSIDAAYAAERVNVSLSGATPLQVVEAIADQFGCLWRARLVLSGDGPADEVYEVDLYKPQLVVVEDAPGKTGPYQVAADPSVFLGTEDAEIVGDVSNTAGVRPNAVRLSVADDAADLYTVLYPVSGGDEAIRTGVGQATWQCYGASAVAGGVRAEAFPYFDYDTAKLVPYDGALVGLLFTVIDIEGTVTAQFPVTGSEAPNILTLGGASTPAAVNGYVFRLRQTAELPAVKLEYGPGIAEHGRVEQFRVFEEVAPQASLRTYLGDVNLTAIGAPVLAATTDDTDVSIGDRSLHVEAVSAEGVNFIAPLRVYGVGKARAFWASLRVVTGRLSVEAWSYSSGGVDDHLISAILVDPSETLKAITVTTDETDAGDLDLFIDLRFKASGGPAVFVIDAVTAVEGGTPQPYQKLMGPNELWDRAWQEMILQQGRTVTATSDFFDLGQLGVSGQSVEAGCWITVYPSGREAFSAQVLEVSWEESLFGGGPSAPRTARFGPPPFSLADRLAEFPDQSRHAEGSKRAPVYPFLIDRGPVPGGHRVEGVDGASFTESTTERTFLGRTYVLDTLDPEPASVDALYVRRPTGVRPRTDAAVLRVTTL